MHNSSFYFPDYYFLNEHKLFLLFTHLVVLPQMEEDLFGQVLFFVWGSPCLMSLGRHLWRLHYYSPNLDLH